MTVSLNPAITKSSSNFGNKPKLKEFGPVEKPLKRDEQIKKATKEAIFYDAAFVVLGVSTLYFMIRKGIKEIGKIQENVKQYNKMKKEFNTASKFNINE